MLPARLILAEHDHTCQSEWDSPLLIKQPEKTQSVDEHSSAGPIFLKAAVLHTRLNRQFAALMASEAFLSMTVQTAAVGRVESVITSFGYITLLHILLRIKESQSILVYIFKFCAFS